MPRAVFFCRRPFLGERTFRSAHATQDDGLHESSSRPLWIQPPADPGLLRTCCLKRQGGRKDTRAVLLAPG